MFDTMNRVVALLRGDGEAAVTIPPWDGALRPNHLLDAADTVVYAQDPSDLVAHQGTVWLADGKNLIDLEGKRPSMQMDSPISAVASLGEQLAVASMDGSVNVFHANRTISAMARSSNPVGSLCFTDEDNLLLATASAQHSQDSFARSLLEKDRSGTVEQWKIGSASPTVMAKDLAFASGVGARGAHRYVAESWRHRILELAPDGKQTVLLGDLPAYPSRMVPAAGGGWWLTCFCARFQLLEFVLREKRYRQEMMRVVEPEYWIAPKLTSGRDWREPLQGAGIQQMGVRKPWAPPQSYGLVIYLDERLRPQGSLQSRSDGHRHGVVAAVQADSGDLFVLSAGAKEVVRVRSEVAASIRKGVAQ